MIGGLIAFLASATYLGVKNISSQVADTQIQQRPSMVGTNADRQYQVWKWSMGHSAEDRAGFRHLLRNANLNGTGAYQAEHEKKREEILEKLEKFDEYSKASPKIRTFADYITPANREYAIWIIAQSEGWTYEVRGANLLPSYCRTYRKSADPYITKRSKRL